MSIEYHNIRIPATGKSKNSENITQASRRKAGGLKRSKSVGHIGEKRNLSGTLDSLGELTLMHGAGAGSAAGKNLAALGKETAKLRSILIINERGLVSTELANLSAPAGLRIGIFIESHWVDPPLQSNQ